MLACARAWCLHLACVVEEGIHSEKETPCMRADAEWCECGVHLRVLSCVMCGREVRCTKGEEAAD